MTRTLLSSVVLSLVIGIGTLAKGDLINGSFETGSLTGWQFNGQVTVETLGSFGVSPAAGQYQALLLNHFPGDFGVPLSQLESFVGLPAGTLDSIGNGPVTQGTGLRQTFSAEAGDQLSFAWNFLADGPDPDFNDFAFFTISPVAQVQQLTNTLGPLVPSSSVFFISETGYNSLVLPIATSGAYTVSFGVVDVGDDLVSSGLLIDNVRVTASAVPEPSSLVLVSVGSLCVFVYRLKS